MNTLNSALFTSVYRELSHFLNVSEEQIYQFAIWRHCVTSAMSNSRILWVFPNLQAFDIREVYSISSNKYHSQNSDFGFFSFPDVVQFSTPSSPVCRKSWTGTSCWVTISCRFVCRYWLIVPPLSGMPATTSHPTTRSGSSSPIHDSLGCKWFWWSFIR